MSEWIPEEICGMDEFLPESLKPLREYVRKTRHDDIAPELHVAEERVLFSSSDMTEELEKIIGGKGFQDKSGSRKLGWETIRTYEHEAKIRGRYVLKKFSVEKRKVKKYFLRGWLELGMWDRGLRRKQNAWCVFVSPEFRIHHYSCMSKMILKHSIGNLGLSGGLLKQTQNFLIFKIPGEKTQGIPQRRVI